MKTTDLIKSFRVKRNLKQEDVAKLLDITRQTYNALENDILNSDSLLMFDLLNVLKLSDNEINEFFDTLKQDYKSYNLQSQGE